MIEGSAVPEKPHSPRPPFGQFMRKWPWHWLTLLVIVGTFLLLPRQAELITLTTSKMMIGACAGYWIEHFFLKSRRIGGDADARAHDWQLVALICAGMLAMRGIG